MLKPKLLSLQKIWDFVPHAALTDLIRFQDRWFCCFRESDEHVHGENGAIRVLYSEDGKYWESVAYFQQRDRDLRDPKLSVTPDGRLMLLIGSASYYEKDYKDFSSLVAFSVTGQTFSPWQQIAEPHEWLWRITWHKGLAYGVSYRWIGLPDAQASLWVSDDGINFSKICDLNVYGSPSEGTIRFLSDDRAVMLLRRDKEGADTALIGIANPPYKEWKWTDTAIHFGGPNFLVMPDGKMWAAGRILQKKSGDLIEKVALCRMQLDGFSSIAILPSGGEDTSYPGMVWHEGVLWLTYYSSHEDTTAIYFASLQLPNTQQFL